MKTIRALKSILAKKFRILKNTILVAHTSRKLYKEDITDIQKKRLDICKSCKYNSDNRKAKNIRELFFKFINNFANRLYSLKVDINSICYKCGCGLIFLSNQEDPENQCKLKKWK